MKSDLNRSEEKLSRSAKEAASDAVLARDSGGRALQCSAAAHKLARELVEHWFSRSEAKPSPVEVCWRDERAPDGGRAHLALSLTRLVRERAPNADHDRRETAAKQEAVAAGTTAYSHELLSTLAHDLNNLLTPILAISASLEQDLSDVHASYDQARDLRVAAERATLFVQRTLSSLRLRAESAVHIGNVVRDMTQLLRLVAGKRITLELDIRARTGLALLDRNRLESCLLDLVSNARDAIVGAGTIALRVSSLELDADQARLLVCEPGAYELVVVEDTGTGIRADVREHIFERHFTTKTGGKGHGLGLTHVRRFVEESGGAITVTSAPGERTMFWLYFPRMRPTPTP